MKVNWKMWSQVVLGLMFLGLLAFGLTGSVQAAEFRGGENVVISAGEVIDDDLFVSGGRVEVNGTIKGDLFASGTEVIVNGDVEGSLALAGQTLTMNGQVDGSVYAGGYALTVGSDANIGRNLYFGGFSLTTEQGSAIGRGLYAGDYQTILNGEVADDVAFGGAALELNGSVGGDVMGEVGSSEQGGPPPFMPNFPGAVPMIAPGLRVGETAEIGGDLNVKETEPEPSPTFGQRVALGASRALSQRLGEFIALLIVGILFLRFWPAIVERASAVAKDRPLRSTGWGCLVTLIFFIGVPIVAVVIFLLALLGGLITFGQLFNDILGLGGATLGLVVVAFFVVLSLVTKIVVAFLGGRLILTRFAPRMQPGLVSDVASLALGALIYEILRAIPIVGWLIGLIVTLIGLGAIYFALRERARPTPLDEPPALEVATA